jgi:hypothetical protein
LLVSFQFFAPEGHGPSIESVVAVPVFGGLEEDAPIVGHYFAVVPWFVYFMDELPPGTAPVVAVVDSSCGQKFTYEIRGNVPMLLSFNEDLHDPQYDDVFVSEALSVFAHDDCEYTLVVYPTIEFESQYKSSDPIYYMLVVLSIFLATSLSFLIFDWFVTKQQSALMTTARKQNALVASLFLVSAKCVGYMMGRR